MGVVASTTELGIQVEDQLPRPCFERGRIVNGLTKCSHSDCDEIAWVIFEERLADNTTRLFGKCWTHAREDKDYENPKCRVFEMEENDD